MKSGSSRRKALATWPEETRWCAGSARQEGARRQRKHAQRQTECASTKTNHREEAADLSCVSWSFLSFFLLRLFLCVFLFLFLFFFPWVGRLLSRACEDETQGEGFEIWSFPIGVVLRGEGRGLSEAGRARAATSVVSRKQALRHDCPPAPGLACKGDQDSKSPCGPWGQIGLFLPSNYGCLPSIILIVREALPRAPGGLGVHDRRRPLGLPSCCQTALRPAWILWPRLNPRRETFWDSRTISIILIDALLQSAQRKCPPSPQHGSAWAERGLAMFDVSPHIEIRSTIVPLKPAIISTSRQPLGIVYHGEVCPLLEIHGRVALLGPIRWVP